MHISYLYAENTGLMWMIFLVFASRVALFDFLGLLGRSVAFFSFPFFVLSRMFLSLFD